MILMKLQPLTDKVLIQADPPRETTKGGLYVTEEWKTLPPTGKVLAVGPDVTAVKPGQRVQFERYASLALEDDQRLCQERHLLAVLPDEA